MDKSFKIEIKNTAFPSSISSHEEGLKVAKAIEWEWFNKRGNSCDYYDKASEFHKLRLYARGMQDPMQYKSRVVQGSDLSYMNLDWNIVKIIPKFVDIVLNGINSRLFYVRAESQDIMSAEQKNSYQEMIEADMVARDLLKTTKQEFGVDIFNTPENELPDNDEELALYMQIRYKPSIEIAAEVGISTLMEMSDYQEIRKRCDQDQIEVGVSALKQTFLPNDGVKIEYIDPARVVHSYTEHKDFSDCFYFGYFDEVHYSELIKINPNLTDEEIKDIKKTGPAWLAYYPIARQYTNDAFSNEIVPLLFFNYKATKDFVYKKKATKGGGSRMIPRESTLVANEDGAFEVVKKTKDVWYTGVLVAGTNKLIKWELMENMIRPKTASQKALPEFIMYAPRAYKGVYDSLVKRMIPLADQIQIAHLKLQQVTASIVPDGVFIDADGLAEVDLGNGSKYTADDALKLYWQTGSVVGRSMTTDGDLNHAKMPLQELTKSSGSPKIASIINSYNHYLNQMRDVTGLNEASDGSSPNPDALVGVQKLAALNSNTATKHILEAGLSVTKRLAECLFLRTVDILKHADFAEEFAMQIGKYNISMLNDIRNLYLFSMGIFIEMSPDAQERDELEMNINIALKEQTIDLEDAIELRQIRNIKTANEALKLKRKNRLKAKQEREDFIKQMDAQAQQALQQSAAESALAKIQAEAEAKAHVKQIEGEVEKQKMDHEAMLKERLMDKEFGFNMQLAGISSADLKERDAMKEEKKDSRLREQLAGQSVIAEQKQKELPAQSFESTEDTLDGFGLDSFGPK